MGVAEWSLGRTEILEVALAQPWGRRKEEPKRKVVFSLRSAHNGRNFFQDQRREPSLLSFGALVRRLIFPLYPQVQGDWLGCFWGMLSSRKNGSHLRSLRRAHPESSGWAVLGARLASSRPSRGSTDSPWGWRDQAFPGVQILGLSPYI